MAQIKISDLPLYTGSTTGVYLVMNNSGETTTYKVSRENIIGASGTSGTSGSSGSSGGTGTSGSNGSSGTSGSNGSSGTSGSSGSNGSSGDSIFAVTGSVWNTTRNVGISGSLNVSGSITQTGSLNIRNTPSSNNSLEYNNGFFRLQNNSTQNYVQSTGTSVFVSNLSGSIASVLQRSYLSFSSGSNGASIDFSNGNKLSISSLGGVDITGSLIITGSNQYLNGSQFALSGSLATIANYGSTTSFILNQKDSDNGLTLINSLGSGNGIADISNNVANFLFKVGSNISGSNPPVQFQRSVGITGSLKVSDIPSGSASNEVVVYNTSTKQLERKTNASSSGTSGTSGINGSSGSSGTSGSNGSSGTSGSNGSSGTSGSNGSSGTSGSNGSSGSSGTSGSNGSSGTSGSSGSSGTSGTSGLLTLTGSFVNGMITYNGTGTNATVQSNVSYTSSSLRITGSVVMNTGSITLTSSSLNINNADDLLFERPSVRISGSLGLYKGTMTLTSSSLGLISSSLYVEGRATTFVQPLTITSNTASMYVEYNNMFALQLPSGSSTYLRPIEINIGGEKAVDDGQTINVMVFPTGSCTLNFHPNVRQVVGDAYVPNNTNNTDILTFITYGGYLYMSNIKNLG